ncbi:UNVERIFIED_CONTAM: metalloendopeptidase [Siphonaria sp. JEL0065]|nr:metalloendopeptidase [Siphonaria sp. JEL0065]
MTQRTRLMLVDEDEEREAADKAWIQIFEKYKSNLIPKDNPVYVKTFEIVHRLISVVGPIRDWDLLLINDPSCVNAMVLANGKILVFKGLLDALWQMDQEYSAKSPPLWKREKTFAERLFSLDFSFTSSEKHYDQHPLFTDTLAAVLAHEMAHVLSRHSAEDMGVSQFFQLFQDAAHSLLYTLSLNLPFLADVSGRAVDAAAPYLSTLPYSRLMEIEADAGYNPQRASEFWKYLAKQVDPNTFSPATTTSTTFSEFMSTHPSHAHRAQELSKHEPAAYEIYRAHKRIEAALKLNLARIKETNKKHEVARKLETDLDHVNHAMYEVLQQFVKGHDAFWYARGDFDQVFVEESLKIVDGITTGVVVDGGDGSGVSVVCEE